MLLFMQNQNTDDDGQRGKRHKRKKTLNKEEKILDRPREIRLLLFSLVCRVMTASLNTGPDNKTGPVSGSLQGQKLRQAVTSETGCRSVIKHNIKQQKERCLQTVNRLCIYTVDWEQRRHRRTSVRGTTPRLISVITARVMSAHRSSRRPDWPQSRLEHSANNLWEQTCVKLPSAGS